MDPPPLRSIRVNCELKAEGATHKVRFLAKDEEKEECLAKETKRIEPGDWNVLEVFLWVDPTRDFLFRIDDEDVTEAPSTLTIRKLTLEETT